MAKSRKVAQPIDMLGNSIENCPTINNKVSVEKQTLTADQKAQARANIELDKVDNTADKDKQVYEANLQWGGKNLAGGFGPMDAAMMPDLGANRFAFLKAEGITIEYSRDNGETWADYGVLDAQKSGCLFGTGAYQFYIGGKGETGVDKSSHQLRVTVNAKLGGCYTVLNKFAIFVSTSGTQDRWCTIDCRNKSDFDAGNDVWEVIADRVLITGWTGWNIINTKAITTYSNDSSQYINIRFTFGGKHDTEYSKKYGGLNVLQILAFGGMGWKTPSILAKTGHLYGITATQNAWFPYEIMEGGSTEAYLLKNKYAPKSIETTVANKVDKVSGKGLSTNDYTAEDKSKLAGIAEGATKTVVENALTLGSTNAIANGTVADKFKEIETEISGLPTSSYVDTAITDVNEKLAEKQEKLISGSNIKTINGASILGNGNITVSGSGGLAPVEVTNGDIDDPVTDIEIDSGSILQFGGKMYYPHFDINTIKALKEGTKWPYATANSTCTSACGETLSDNGDYIGMFINKINWTVGNSGPAISGMDMLVVWMHRYNDAGVDIYLIERVNY